MNSTKNFFMTIKEDAVNRRPINEYFDHQPQAFQMSLYSSYMMFKKPLTCKMTKYGTIINDAQIWEGSNCKICDGKANMLTRFTRTDEDMPVCFKIEEDHIERCGERH